MTEQEPIEEWIYCHGCGEEILTDAATWHNGGHFLSCWPGQYCVNEMVTLPKNPRTGKMGMTYEMHLLKGGVYSEFIFFIVGPSR